TTLTTRTRRGGDQPRWSSWSPRPFSLLLIFLARLQRVATADRHETAALRLSGLDQRYTRGRRALVSVLAAADAALALHQLLEQAPRLAQSSAYRTLTVLERAGIVHRIVTSDEFARYELAEDLTGHHHHL